MLTAATSAHGSTAVIHGVDVEMEGVAYRRAYDDQQVGTVIEVELEAKKTISESVRAYVRGRARRDNVLDRARDEMRLREASLEARFGSLDIKAGRLIHAWGRTDTLNPTNNLAPRSWVDLLDDDKEELGSLSASARYYSTSWDLELIASPFHQGSRLPPVGSRWFMPLPGVVSLPGQPGLTVPAVYQISTPDGPDEPWRQPQYGLRLTANLPGWAVSLSYFDGWSVLPYFWTPPEATFNGVALIIPVRQAVNRQRVLGVDFATMLGSYGFRGEGAYFFTRDPRGKKPDVDDPYLHYVVGIDRRLSNVFGDLDVFALLEWSHQIASNDIEYQTWDIAHVFRRALFARVTIESRASWAMKVDVVYDMATESALFRPAWEYELSDNVKVETILDMPVGRNGSFFGSFDRNQAVRVRLVYAQGLNEQ